jgi:hypothetical protein
VSVNPFEVLKLDPSAGEEQIVQRAALLRQTSTDEATLTAVRQAVQALTNSAAARQLESLLTHPAPVHDWPRLDRLTAVFRRPPEEATAQAQPVSLDVEEIRELLQPLLTRSLENPPLLFEPPAIRETTEEIMRQSIEGLWQILPNEMLS